MAQLRHSDKRTDIHLEKKKASDTHLAIRLQCALFVALLFGLLLDFLIEEVRGHGVNDEVEEGKALNKW